MSELTINKLYNLDESRISHISPKETFQVPLDTEGKYYLKHIPKKGTLVIKDLTTGFDVVLTSSKKPGPGEAWFEYRDEYDYVAAKGMLVFNDADVKERHEYEADYVPVASRVDATVINQLIDAAGGFGTVWTKEELALPAQNDIIAWTAIKNRPKLATTAEDGLLSKEDKAKLNLFPEDVSIPPMTKLVFTDSLGTNPKEFYPDTWGTPLTFKLSNEFIVNHTTAGSYTGGIISISENGIRNLLNFTNKLSRALEGTTEEEPSADNKFVTSKDPRLTDARDPKTHQHAILDVVGLQTTLNSKAEISHEHSIDDISGIEALRGEDGISPNIHISPNVEKLDPTALPYVINESQNPQNVILKFGIPRGTDGSVKVKWDDLTPEEKKQIRGEKGETGNHAAVLVGDVYTGEAGTPVEISWTGPTEIEIDDKHYEATTMNITIPKGDKGEKGDKGDKGDVGAPGRDGTDGENGLPGAAIGGTVETLTPGSQAQVIVHAPVPTEISGQTFYASKLDFKIPKGDRGDCPVVVVSFNKTDAWSAIDENENYTLTIPRGYKTPMSPAYEVLDDLVTKEFVLATLRFDANNIYVIADHKFSGEFYANEVLP